jgi:hypothetical protein
MACGRPWSPADCSPLHGDGGRFIALRRWARAGSPHRVSDSNCATPMHACIRQSIRVRLANRVAGARYHPCALSRSALFCVLAANPNCLVTPFGLTAICLHRPKARRPPRQGPYHSERRALSPWVPKSLHQLRRRGVKRARRSAVPVASATSPLTRWSRTSAWRPAPVTNFASLRFRVSEIAELGRTGPGPRRNLLDALVEASQR